MGRGKIPSIFVSSTCYDLGQVRNDLRIFLKDLGLEPVLSEYNTFPINPNIGTIDNCIQNVETKADIFILIIGGRYGSQNDDGKSITNLEYLRAKAKGIPIYTFVSKNILSTLSIWKDNPTSDFKSVVDSPKLFEFVNSIKVNDSLWIFPFETAQEIMDTIKIQLAFLFAESLDIRTKAYSTQILESLSEYKGDILRLALEKPMAWEYRLFGEVLHSGIKMLNPLRRDVKYGIAFGQCISFSDLKNLVDYIVTKIYELRQVGVGLEILLNTAFQEAAGLPGEPGDPEHIVYVAEKIVEAYKNVLLWTVELRRLKVEDEWENLIAKVALFSENMILEIEQYCDEINNQLKQALIDIAKDDKPIMLTLKLTLTTKGSDEFTQELERLAIQYGVNMS
jgi:hypothetical protein